MEQYKAEIADNPKVTWIHISHDREEEAAAKWAESAGFPWLTVLPEDIDDSDLLGYATANSVPHYVMVDGEGNVVANDVAAVFAKVKQLD